MSPGTQGGRRGLANLAGVVLGGLAYYLTLFDYTRSTTRTANALGYASGFFDLQARAFLAGHLWVPRGSLGIEGFVEHGREYMYFPPFPALLRIPVLLTTHEFDGRLTQLSMALAFVLLAVMTVKLLWLVRDLLYPDDPVTRFEAAMMGVLLTLCLGGTSLTYTAALPWVYHEVYAWAVPLSIGAMYWMLRVLREPTPRSLAWLFAFDVCLILTRTTGGWAVCLVTMGCGVWLLRGRLYADRTDRRVLGWSTVAAGALALSVGIAYNMVKFRHPYLFPLQNQTWTALNGHRREALAVNGGTITGPQFFPSAFMAYFRPDGIRFVDYFPYVTLPARPAQGYAGAFIDQSYRTGSVTGFMPWLLALTVSACLLMVRRGAGVGMRMLRAPLLAGVLTTGGVMAYGYLAYRYTCEFVPALVLGGGVGTVVLTHSLQRRGRWLPAAGLALAVTATVYSIAANMITGYTAAAFTSGGPRLDRYLTVQHRLSPAEQAGLVRRGTGDPGTGRPDDVFIRGNCDAMYLQTGDTYHEWELVDRRSTLVKLTFDRHTLPGRVRVATIGTTKESSVWVQNTRHHRARVQLVNPTGSYYGHWFDLLEPREVRVGVRDRPDFGYAEVTSTPGGWVGFVQSYDWTSDGLALPIEITPGTATSGAARRGVHLSVERGIAPPTCEQLRRAG